MTDAYCSSEILCSVIFVPLYQDYNVECCILEGTSFDCNFKVTTLNFESNLSLNYWLVCWVTDTFQTIYPK